MKYFEGLFHTLNSWNDVAQALFKRYPNPYSKHVLSEDVIDRWVDGEKLHTIKLITKTNPLPKWGERLYSGPRFVSVVEESIVDVGVKSFMTYTRNISMSKYMSCTEKCVYRPDTTHPQKTSIQKLAWFDSQLGYGLSIPILEFSTQRYKKNQLKATLGLEYIMGDVHSRSFKDIVKEKKQKISDKAKVISTKAKQATDLAKSKAEQKGRIHAKELDE